MSAQVGLASESVKHACAVNTIYAPRHDTCIVKRLENRLNKRQLLTKNMCLHVRLYLLVM